jgi:hypothetical protein
VHGSMDVLENCRSGVICATILANAMAVDANWSEDLNFLKMRKRPRLQIG